jgi:hypothetical protein
MKFLIMQFLHTRDTPSRLSSDVLLSTMLSQTTSVYVQQTTVYTHICKNNQEFHLTIQL